MNLIENKLLRGMLIIVGILNFLWLHGQNLEQHRWKNRVLIIQTPEDSLPQYLEQLSEFKHSDADFKERRLVLYEIIKDKYWLTDFQDKTTNKSWKLTNEDYTLDPDKKNKFRVVLIGLDEGIKLEQETILKTADLLGLIDSMPMRKAELRTKLSNRSKKHWLEN